MENCDKRLIPSYSRVTINYYFREAKFHGEACGNNNIPSLARSLARFCEGARFPRSSEHGYFR